MSVHPKRKGYEVRWKQGGRQHGRMFSRKGDADRFDLEIKRRRQAGGIIDLDVGRETLAQWMEEWWRVYAIPNLKPATRGTYAQIWAKHILNRLGPWEIRDITPAVLEDFRAQLHAAHVGDPTVIKALGLLQGLLKRAAIRGKIPANPVLLIDKPRQARGRPPAPLPPATVERIRSFMGQRDATLVSVLAYAGLRPQEATSARWGHLGERALRVEASKTGQLRHVRILAPLAKDLAEWRLASGSPGHDELIFPRPDGQPWADHDWRNWRRRVYQGSSEIRVRRGKKVRVETKGAAPRAGVTGDMRPYRLRGSFVSLLLWEGRSVPKVAEQAGHTVATLSAHYAGVLEELEGTKRVPAEDAIRAARDKLRNQPALFEASS